MDTPFTPGAQRVWQLAADIARALQAERLETEHLLWALAADESRASEILAARRLTANRLQELIGPLPALSVEGKPTDAPVPRSESVELVSIEARRQVALIDRRGEIGTEHLLCALAAVESPVQRILIEHGLGAEAAGRQSALRSGDAAGPIAAEIQLSLAGPPAADQTDLLRILDAAANRAREGLRVLEDYVRFSADDRHLTEILKSWRHRLTEALASLEGRGLISARDARGDVGTSVHTPAEQTRETLIDVVRASCKRVQEAARSLEEYGKIVSPEFAQALGQLRYASYTIEKAILTTAESRDRLENCRLYLLVTQGLCPNGAGPVIRAALAAGANVIQVREKDLSDRELVQWGKHVREWTAAAGALYIMNDRPDLAVLTDADGVHVGQDELLVREARRVVGPARLVGVSTHNIDQARSAVFDGADYVGVGPVFPSGTKAFGEFPGLEFVRQVAAEITLPAFAIGGINAQNITQVVTAGAERIAVSGAICQAEDPGQATRDLLAKLVHSEPPG
jgi:thiamine-phosphate pyrophosphorylase